MGRKNLVFCDLCKQESDPDKFHKLIFKKPDKKAGNTYEICSGCATNLQTQLISDINPTLKPQSEILKDHSRRQALEDSQSVDDEEWIDAKEVEIKAFKEDDTIRERVVTNGPELIKPDIENCIHLNKSKPHMGMIGDKKGWYRRCVDCQKQIPYTKLKDRASVNKADTGSHDIVLKDGPTETRKRS